MAQFEVFWSLAAFEKVGKDFLPTHSRILAELRDVTAGAYGWLLHAVEIEGGFLRCDADKNGSAWKVFVREALCVPTGATLENGTPVTFPEAINSSDNERFAKYEEILEAKKQKKAVITDGLFSKTDFPLSRE